jgi:hypothetical protein
LGWPPGLFPRQNNIRKIFKLSYFCGMKKKQFAWYSNGNYSKI